MSKFSSYLQAVSMYTAKRTKRLIQNMQWCKMSNSLSSIKTTILCKTLDLKAEGQEISTVTNSRAKPQQTPSVEKHAIHQGWFTALYTKHLLDSQSLEFEICVFPREAIPSHYFPLREDSWPGDNMGKATQVRQLSLSHS